MKDKIRLRRKTVYFNQYQTCKIGGSICSGRCYQRADKPQSAFHHGQKCGYFLVIPHDSTGQELVNDRQQSLHVLGKGRRSQTDWRGLSGRTALRVNINISQRVHRHLNTMWSGVVVRDFLFLLAAELQPLSKSIACQWTAVVPPVCRIHPRWTKCQFLKDSGSFFSTATQIRVPQEIPGRKYC